MPLNLRPTKRQLAELVTTSSVSDDSYDKLHLALSVAPSATTLSPDWLIAECQRAIGDPDVGATMGRLLLSLSGMARRLHAPPSEVVESFQSNSDEAFVAHGTLCRLLECQIVEMASKAIDLSYDHANLVRSIRVLTDVRPIFSEDAMGISGAVVSHTLRAFFTTIDGDEEVSLVLDQRDIESLKRECERALLKAETCRSAFKDLPILIPGEEEE